MNEPIAAIRKVATALRETLSNIQRVVTVDVDRSQEEPFGNAEVPAINIRLVAVEFEEFDHAHTLHRCDVDLDIVTDNRNYSISADQADIGAMIVGKLWADRFLGGRLVDMLPRSMTGDAENGADIGAVPLKYELTFLTPIGDHFTLVGQAGQTF